MATPRARSKKQRGNIEALPSGALRVRVYAGTDPVTGRRYDLKELIPTGPEAGKQAERALARLVNQIHERQHPRTNATLDQLLDKHLEMMHVAETTRRTYRRHIDKHIKPLIGGQKVGRLDATILDSFYAELLRCRQHCRNKRTTDHRTPKPHTCDKRCGPHTCEPLAAWTVRKIHFILSGAYERAVRWKWVSTNPVTQADPPPAPTPDPRPPSAQEAARLLNEAWKDLDFGTLVWTVMTTSPRRAEVCGLRWRHFEADKQLLTFHRNIAQDGAESWEKDTKTHQRRNIALDSETVAVLSDYKLHCEKRAAALGLSITEDSFIFSLTPDGTDYLKPESLTQRYRRLAERLGIETSLHKLRHYSATELIAAGVDIRTVAGRLGHSGGGTTTLKVYAAWVSEADQRASTTLMSRVPTRPAPPLPRAERAKTDPQAPYEKIAAQLRREILAGQRSPGDAAPTMKELQAEHGIGAGTAHRAIGLLKSWGLVEASRGRRAMILDSPELVASTAPEPEPEPEPDVAPSNDQAHLLDLRLLHLGDEARSFTAKADPSNPEQLHRLLAGAARRHGGKDVDVAEYELEVRRAGDPQVITTFAAL